MQSSVAPELDVRPFVTNAGRDASPRFSRDGEWLAYVHEIDEKADLFVRPTGAGEPVVAIVQVLVMFLSAE